MAYIYYPKESEVYTRNVSGSNLVEQYIGIEPNTIFIFDGHTELTASITIDGGSL